MEIKKIPAALLVAASTITASLAAEVPAPGPSSNAFSIAPAVGAAVAVSALSFLAYYFH